MRNIPVKNIYYIFCYAWQRFDVGYHVSVGAEDSPDIHDLLAKGLLNAAKAIMKKGVDREYVQHLEDLSCTKGKIIFGESIKRNLLRQMRAHCSYDHLNHNILHNQILKTTLLKLSRVNTLNKNLKQEIKQIALKLHDVDEIKIQRSSFRYVKIHRNNSYYDFIMKICELINSNLLPDEKGSGFYFADFLNDENKMGLVFESFVRNFYHIEQNDYKVKSEEIKWNASAENLDDLTYLPKMKTDISLTANDQKIIIDTKFYKQTLQSYHGTDTIHSTHLYQLLSYLHSVGTQSNINQTLEGVLLYPTTNLALDKKFEIEGRKLRIYTLDLNQAWVGIKKDLLSLIKR